MRLMRVARCCVAVAVGLLASTVGATVMLPTDPPDVTASGGVRDAGRGWNSTEPRASSLPDCRQR